MKPLAKIKSLPFQPASLTTGGGLDGEWMGFTMEAHILLLQRSPAMQKHKENANA